MPALLLALALACTGPDPTPEPLADPVAAPAAAPVEEPTAAPSAPVGAAPPPPGEATPDPTQADAAQAGCLSDADCAEGQRCEGLGCDDQHPGACVGPDRICTRDLRPFCGCDGQTFLASGSCPERRYQAAKPCPGQAPAAPAGEAVQVPGLGD